MGLKESYQEKARSQLDEWREWIQQYQLHKDASLYGTEEQQRAEQMEACYQLAWQRIEALSSSSDGHWEDAKRAVEQAMVELKRLLDASGAGKGADRVRLEKSRAYVYDPFYKKGSS